MNIAVVITNGLHSSDSNVQYIYKHMAQENLLIRDKIIC